MTNHAIYWRYVVEYFMLLPGALCCLIPSYGHFRVSIRKVIPIFAVLLIVGIFGGAALSTRFRLPTNTFLLPLTVLLYLLTGKLVAYDWRKWGFVFLNGMMLTAWGTLFTNYLFAVYELSDSSGPFTLRTGLACLGITFAVVLFFYHLLRVRIPALLTASTLDFLWNWFFIVPLLLTVFFVWCLPLDVKNVLVGRVRTISLFAWIGVLLLIYLMYQLLWTIADGLAREMRLRQENQLFQAEKQRYRQLEDHSVEMRKVHHDFRQHLRILSELVNAGKFDEMREYLDRYVKTIPNDPKIVCLNPAVDALASYYRAQAERKQVRIFYDFGLPAALPVSEIDYCVIFGNLLENALHAVVEVEPDEREIRISSRMIGPGMLGLEVTNRYAGNFHFTAEDDIDLISRGSVGLSSIASAAARCNGTFTIEAKNNFFSACVLFNLP